MGASLTGGRSLFIATWVAVISLMFFAPHVMGEQPRFEDVVLLFWFVAVAAGLCVLTAVALAYVAFSQDVPELGFVSLWFLVLSVLALVHGLTTPGVLYGSTTSFNSAIFLAGPLGAIAGAPIVIRGRLSTAAAQRWKVYHLVAVILVGALAAVLLAWPNLVTTPAATSPWAIFTAVPTTVIAASYSWRHLQFVRISGQHRHLVVFFGFAFTGVANLVWLSPAPFGPTFWFAHVFEVVGVLHGTVGGLIIFWRHPHPSALFGPVLTADPLVALDLGLDPSVSAYMEVLDAKDSVTRDHALRTAESVVHVAARLGLPPATVRDAGIAGVLHDIGKIGIPVELLNKPGRLTDEEFEVMKTHTDIGFELIRRNPRLRGVAPLVLSHHERIDGRGYPNGLVGDEIPLAARVVSVCDAYDAMAHDRPYRSGMGAERAVAILQEHMGTQWDAKVAQALIDLAEEGAIRTKPIVLDHLGREWSGSVENRRHEVLCGCLDAVPADVAQEFA